MLFHRGVLAGLCALSTLCGQHLWAHPGGHGGAAAATGRVWTLAVGGFHEHGAYVSADDEQVQIRREDGSLTQLKLDWLSDEDRQWVRTRREQLRLLNEVRAILATDQPTATAQSSLSPAFGVPVQSDLHRGGEGWGEGQTLWPPHPGPLPHAAGWLQGDGSAVGERELRFQDSKQLRTLLLAQNRPPQRNVPAANPAAAPLIRRHFEPFAKTLQLRWDDRWFYVESNGIPDHPLMVGITSWQQQAPIPQKYVGDNAWRIPLHPVPAKEPRTAKGEFLRGAIALAVNGVPIFNPLNNRGDDAYLFGELDEYGGHCGRADDYHYHIAPVHLEQTVGEGEPIAYALDGYPIYGYQEKSDPDYAPLDWLNGHNDAQGNYHYHATKTYPYLNGGFYGEVVERDGQVDPQPRAEPLRPALPPLRGAKITGFTETQPGTFRLTYTINGRDGTVTYTLSKDGSAKFVFTDPSGRTTTENYSARPRGGERPPRPGDGPPPRPGDRPPPRDGRRPPPRPGDPPPPRPGDPPPQRGPAASASHPADNLPQLQVTSSSVNAAGFISVDCTCDGKSESPAVAWSGAPAGTKSYAVSLWHIAPDQEKSYWVVYNIPAGVTKLAAKSPGAGTLGLNDKRRAEYDPMCSKGPGVKEYHLTVYALSAEPKLSANNATRAGLLDAIKGITLAHGTLDFKYERGGAR